MFKSTVFDEGFIGNVAVGAHEAVGEAKIGLWIGVDAGGAEFDDIAHTFGGAVHTGYTVVIGGCADVREGEVYFGKDLLHCWEDEELEAGLQLC